MAASTAETHPDAGADKQRAAKRTQRMQMVLKKALNVSVSNASLLDVRAFFEDECRQQDAALLAQIFMPATRVAELRAAEERERRTHRGHEGAGTEAAVPIEQQQQAAGELSALALQTLRQHIEAAFAHLCTRHGVDDALKMLEEMVEEAQTVQMQQLASEELGDKTEETQDEPRGGAKTEDVEPDLRSPEELIRAERIRVKEAERTQLELLVRQRQEALAQQERSVERKRAKAAEDVAQLDSVSNHVEEATALAQDFSMDTN